jgi:HAMP domain-containing protein
VVLPGGASGETAGAWAVAVTASLDAVTQARQRGRRAAMWFALAAVVLLTGVVDWFFRRLVHARLADMRETMALAGRGALDVRVPISQADEIGELAAS